MNKKLKKANEDIEVVGTASEGIGSTPPISGTESSYAGEPNDIEYIKALFSIHDDKIRDLRDAQKDFDKKAENLDRLTKEIKNDELPTLKKQIDDSKLKIVESLAIFGLFIVFVTSGTQVLIRVPDLQSVIILLTALFSLTTLLFLAFDAVVTNNNKPEQMANSKDKENDKKVEGDKDNKNEKEYLMVWLVRLHNWLKVNLGNKAYFLTILMLILLGASLVMMFFKMKIPLNPIEGTAGFNEVIDKKVEERLNKKIEEQSLKDRLEEAEKK